MSVNVVDVLALVSSHNAYCHSVKMIVFERNCFSLIFPISFYHTRKIHAYFALHIILIMLSTNTTEMLVRTVGLAHTLCQIPISSTFKKRLLGKIHKMNIQQVKITVGKSGDSIASQQTSRVQRTGWGANYFDVRCDVLSHRYRLRAHQQEFDHSMSKTDSISNTLGHHSMALIVVRMCGIVINRLKFESAIFLRLSTDTMINNRFSVSQAEWN